MKKQLLISLMSSTLLFSCGAKSRPATLIKIDTEAEDICVFSEIFEAKKGQLFDFEVTFEKAGSEELKGYASSLMLYSDVGSKYENIIDFIVDNKNFSIKYNNKNLKRSNLSFIEYSECMENKSPEIDNTFFYDYVDDEIHYLYITHSNKKSTDKITIKGESSDDFHACMAQFIFSVA